MAIALWVKTKGYSPTQLTSSLGGNSIWNIFWLSKMPETHWKICHQVWDQSNHSQSINYAPRWRKCKTTRRATQMVYQSNISNLPVVEVGPYDEYLLWQVMNGTLLNDMPLKLTSTSLHPFPSEIEVFWNVPTTATLYSYEVMWTYDRELTEKADRVFLLPVLL